MSWIRLAVAGAAFLGVTSVADAQAPQGGPPPQGGHSHEGGPKSRGGSKMLFNGIDLTDAQQAEVQKITEKYKAEREAMRAAGAQAQGPPDEATRARMKELSTRSHAEYRAVLTADQQVIFDKNVAGLKARMEQKQKQGPPTPRA